MINKNTKVYVIFTGYNKELNEEYLISPVGFLSRAGAIKFLKGYIDNLGPDVMRVSDIRDYTYVKSRVGKKATWYYKITWIRVF